MAAAFKQAMRACANPVRPPRLVGRSMLREFGPATENGAALLREASLAPLLAGDTPLSRSGCRKLAPRPKRTGTRLEFHLLRPFAVNPPPAAQWCAALGKSADELCAVPNGLAATGQFPHRAGGEEPPSAPVKTGALSRGLARATTLQG